MLYTPADVNSDLGTHDSSSLLLYSSSMIAFSRYYISTIVHETYYGQVVSPVETWKASVNTMRVRRRLTCTDFELRGCVLSGLRGM